MPNFKHDFIPVLDQLNRMFMAMSRKFVSQLIIFSYKGYFEIVLGFGVVFFFLQSTYISIGYRDFTLNLQAFIANLKCTH